MNLDVSDPSVDPKRLLLEFQTWLKLDQNQTMCIDNAFTDFAVFLWVYEDSKDKYEAKMIIDHTNELRKEIQLLLAVWIEADYLHVSHGNNSETLFSIKPFSIGGKS